MEYCCCSVAQSCLILCNPMDCSTPDLPVPHHLPECVQVHVPCTGDASRHLILWHPLLLLPSIFPSIWDFSNESTVLIRWPNYWSISFSISPSNEDSGLISFKIDWFDLLAIQETLRSLLQHHSSKASILLARCLFYGPALTTTCDPLGRPQLWLHGPLLAEWYLCISKHCLGLSPISYQEAFVLWFHGCSHHLQWL